MLNRWVLSLINRVRRPLQIIKRAEAELDHSAIEFEPDRDDRARLAKGVSVLIVVMVCGGVAWSVLARLDVVVSARGRIDSISSAQTLKSSRGGRVTAVLVKDGDSVTAGQTLVQFDKTEVLNQLSALRQQQAPLAAQVDVLRTATSGQLINLQDPRLTSLPEIAANIRQLNLINAQLLGSPTGLSPDQQVIFSLFMQRVNAINANQQVQAEQSRSQSVGTIAQLNNANAQLQIELDKLGRLRQLFDEGGISRNGVLQQVGTANEVQKTIIQTQIQQSQLAAQQQQSQIGSQQQIEELYRQLLSDRTGLIAQLAGKQRDAQDQLVRINSQIKQAEFDLGAQEVKAPTAGTVTGLEVTLPGVIKQPGEPLLQVTPSESLIATVEVTPADIANLKVGTPVEVRLDALPFTEFGAIPGSIINISSNTTATQNGQSFFRVPIRLEKPILERNGQRHPIKNGMTITAQMKVRTQRPIDAFLGPIASAIDNALKSGR